MANFTITITNSVRAFGPAPSDKWGTGTAYNMTWGTTKWGEGTQDLVASVRKLLTNGISLAETPYLSTTKVIQNTIGSSEDLTSEGVTDGSGYTFIFPGEATNAENRVISTYSAAAAATTTYNSSSAGTTTWS